MWLLLIHVLDVNFFELVVFIQSKRYMKSKEMACEGLYVEIPLSRVGLPASRANFEFLK